MWLETGRDEQDLGAALVLNGMSSEQMGRSCPGDCQREMLEEQSGEPGLGTRRDVQKRALSPVSKALSLEPIHIQLGRK